MQLWLGSIEQGLLFGLMAIGVYLTFRVLNFADLTVDGSFALGGAVAAHFIVLGVDPWLSTFFSLLAGGAAGLVTGILHTKAKINGLLAGILTMIALWSINLRIMGRANVSLNKAVTIKTKLSALEAWGLSTHTVYMIVFFMLLIAVKLLVDWFLRTDLGMAMRATGDNPTMITSFGVNTDQTILTGLMLSNALVGLSGGLIAQYQGYADIQMGVGMIIIGLASVIIGEAVIGARSIFRATLAAAVGAILYRFIVAVALWREMPPSDLKLLTAVIVVLALVIPQLITRFRMQLLKNTLANGGAVDPSSSQSHHLTLENKARSGKGGNEP
ncbi:MAG: ABC transporter permease [Candidatus Carbobacillus altaicus]|nr:ABC transporter permease [Candidatus Carbobacillus altaicus]